MNDEQRKAALARHIVASLRKDALLSHKTPTWPYCYADIACSHGGRSQALTTLDSSTSSGFRLGATR